MIQMSTFFSAEYLLLFLPIVVLLMAISTQKMRRVILLLANYVLFWAFSEKLLIYLLFTTFSIHHFGLWISQIGKECEEQVKICDKTEKKTIKQQYLKQQQKVMTFAVVLHIGILILLKYTPFFATNINSLFRWMNIPIHMQIPKFMVPIGISFYTLQGVSYMFDVYRKKISADRNLLKLALFISFFPQIMEGPITRYSDTAEQLWNVPCVGYQNFMFGVQRIVYGLMKKIVVADRLNIFIKNVFNDYGSYDGLMIAIAVIGYTAQLYMEFSGTMDIVLGSGQIFGIILPENFERPFFSLSISEFWKRWHISLGTWFRDYIFYPLSMSKPLKKLTVKARKKLGNHFGPLLAGGIALFAVWLCNGLWHGAGWHYIFFGMYHFFFILFGSMIEPYAIRCLKKIHINRNGKIYRGFRMIRTALLVCIGELFFRADSLGIGFGMFRKMLTDFSFSSIKNQTIYSVGLDEKDFVIVFVSLLIILIVGIFEESGIRIREKIAKKNIVVRFAFYYALILFIIIFGAYGRGYVPVDPIYANF